LLRRQSPSSSGSAAPDVGACHIFLNGLAAEEEWPSTGDIVEVISVITRVGFVGGFLGGRVSGGVVRVAPLERAVLVAVSSRRAGGRTVGDLWASVDAVTGA
jgi:hypothetical protein